MKEINNPWKSKTIELINIRLQQMHDADLNKALFEITKIVIKSHNDRPRLL